MQEVGFVFYAEVSKYVLKCNLAFGLAPFPKMKIITVKSRVWIVRACE